MGNGQWGMGNGQWARGTPAAMRNCRGNRGAGLGRTAETLGYRRQERAVLDGLLKEGNSPLAEGLVFETLALGGQHADGDERGIEVRPETLEDGEAITSRQG